MKVELVHIRVPLQEVLGFWAKDFHPPKGEHIRKWDAFVDPHRGEVIFELLVEKPDGAKPGQ